MNSIKNLKQAAMYCHDALFYTDKISFDKPSGMFILPIDRLLFEGMVLEKNYASIKIWLLPR